LTKDFIMQRTESLPVAVDAMAADLDYETFLSRLGQRDRQAIERHVAVCETESSPAHAALWRRLACMLAAVASRPTGNPTQQAAQTARQFGVQTAGQRAVQFFAPDGKYRRQVFALEDLRDGVLSVYTIDELKGAVAAGALKGPVKTDGAVKIYEVSGGGAGHGTVRIESITAATLGSAPDYYRHMVGWNRTAVKVTMAVTTSEADVAALKVLFAMGGQQVAGKA
jgi:hypothetical protein